MWGLILFLLKLRGRAVGCAAGRAFVRNDAEHHRRHRNNTGVHRGSTEEENSFSATSTEQAKFESSQPSCTRNSDEEEESFSLRSSLPSTGESYSECDTEESERYRRRYRSGSTNTDNNQNTSSSSAQRYDHRHNNSNNNSNMMDSASVDESYYPNSTGRARRTRIAFFFFGTLTLACVPLVLIFSFAPLQESANSINDYVEQSRDVTEELQISLNSLSTATENAADIVQRTPTNFTQICPLVDANNASSVLSVDLSGMLDLFMSQYAELEGYLSGNITAVNEVIKGVDDAMDFVQITNAEGTAIHLGDTRDITRP